MTQSQRQRIIDYGEVFTPASLVNDMLDLVAHECERIDSRFLEPACGDGNFLAEVLRRKLRTVDKQNARDRGRWERGAILAACSLYGIDLLADNVAVCRQRLADLVAATCTSLFGDHMPAPLVSTIAFIFSRNIVQGDALTLLTVEGKPIVFSEWSPINGTMIKRRDFKYAHLLGHADIMTQPLFSDLDQDVFLPEPVAEFPPCHYLKLTEADMHR